VPEGHRTHGSVPDSFRSSVASTGRLRGRSAPRSPALAAMLAPCRLRASPCDARSPVTFTSPPPRRPAPPAARRRRRRSARR
jgi:hypothetical protein